ncbi:RNAse III [Fluviicoccus keumensis]|uniref:Ribonuclease 3 n=1 Tax=Fluviicoccus keumensis TaxID=1435465 RepID=A0A4Q7Z5H5_9GAMM|nr:ribonuclease III [Fluviicoccus keumensis]RZU44899.1 RNAse III [Fluviicoccus keumensis]
MSDHDRLYRGLGYRFKQPELLELALTHRSVSGNRNNERLEFLGDSILGMLVAEYLFQHFPKEKEGRLTRLRASLVNQDMLARLARELHIGDFLRLGSGELKSGGFRRDSILADGFEAILGAIYLDSGDIAVCRDCLYRWYGEHLANVESTSPAKDPKSRLQEYLQAHHRELPVYTVLEVTGADHDQHFRVACEVEGGGRVDGEGASRRYAEQAAAVIMLKQLGIET